MAKGIIDVIFSSLFKAMFGSGGKKRQSALTRKPTPKRDKAVITFQTNKGAKEITSDALNTYLAAYREDIKRWKPEVKKAEKAGENCEIDGFDANALASAKRTQSELEAAHKDISGFVDRIQRDADYSQGAMTKIESIEDRIAELLMNSFLEDAIFTMEQARDNPGDNSV